MSRVDEFRMFMCDHLINDISIDSVVQQLDEMDYFEAPASVGHHGNYSGGLYDHSYEVTVQLLDLSDALGLKWERPESPYIIGMFHDLCKCRSYKKIPKSSDDRSEVGDEWIYDKFNLLPGHGDTSVILTQQVVGPLTEEEIMCIRWHMGAFDDKEKWSCYSEVVKLFPNVLYTHTADMIASQICGT